MPPAPARTTKLPGTAAVKFSPPRRIGRGMTPTKPSKASKARRLTAKKKVGAKKATRKKVRRDD